MSDDTVAPDSVAETALRLLPVPEHRAGFWSALGERLDAEPPVDEPALAVGPRRVLVAAPTEPDSALPDPASEPDAAVSERADEHSRLFPPALRRRSNIVMVVVAVAAAVMVVVAGSMLLRQRTTPGLVSTDSGAASDDDAAAAAAASKEASASNTAASTTSALAWVKAMGSGDTKTAWGMLGAASQAHFGNQAAFAERGAAAQADYTRWAASKAEDALVMELVSESGAVHVVTLVGAAKQDGVTVRWAVAIPLRLAQGIVQIEPFAFAGELDLVVPRAGAPGGPLPVVAIDDELVVVVPRGVAAPSLRLDGGPTLICGTAEGTELSQLDDQPGQRCSYGPAKAMAAGRRVLTVAFLSPDGSGIAAQSILFEAV